ncbi:uncharacterized protein [Dysidea avara]|uniref:uncharacterized protein n=1 Tax=Dysidea avara TaxID=196820 RepID=UPI00331703D7
MYTGFIAAVVLLSFGGESDAHTLKVVEDVTLERGSTNFNYLKYLIVGLHPNYPKKRSLLKFEDVPSRCGVVKHATMYLYYQYSHKASFQTDAQAPFITRTIQAHRVLKSWKETEATSTKRDYTEYWGTQWLGLDDIDAESSSTGGQTTIHYGQQKGFVGIDVTSAVNEWKAGEDNYGLVIWATNENIPGRDTRFASKSESDPTKHPFIEVKCDHP